MKTFIIFSLLSIPAFFLTGLIAQILVAAIGPEAFIGGSGATFTLILFFLRIVGTIWIAMWATFKLVDFLRPHKNQ
jgi:hypothetical protein